MKVLANPVILRAAVVLFCATTAFLMGIVFIRLLRKSISEDAEVSSGGAASLQTLPMHVYNTVIQQLKQQKHELQVQTQAEQRRARSSENFSQAVLANLSSGVLVFGVNGLVKQTNPAAKKILGYASPTGMSAEDIFRGAEKDSGAKGHQDSGLSNGLAGEVDAVLREGSGNRQSEVDYVTPGGEKRRISLMVSPVAGADGTLLGAACVINDRSEFESIRRQQELQSEISAEMALSLRTSLATISGYAQQLANNRDSELGQQLAGDIAAEAAHLDERIGGFLTQKRPHEGMAAQVANG